MAARCVVESCGRPCRYTGYCRLHHQRVLVHGDPDANAHERFDPSPALRLAAVVVVDRGGVVSVSAVARMLSTTRKQVQRWRAGSMMYAATADRAAACLGVHPAELWPGW